MNKRDQRYHDYLATAVEDWDARDKIELTDEEIDALHKARFVGEKGGELYYAIQTIRKADHIYKNRHIFHDGSRWTIQFIRWMLTRERTRKYVKAKDDVSETLSYRNWPLFAHITRECTSLPQPTRLEVEIEFQLFYPVPDFDAEWKRWQRELQEEAIELAQWVYQDERRWDLLSVVFMPDREDVIYRYTLTCGTHRKSETFPLMQAYDDMIRKTAAKYQLSPDKGKIYGVPLQRHSSDELSEAIEGFRQGILTYDPEQGAPAGWLKRITQQRLIHAFRDQSMQLSPAELKAIECDSFWKPPDTDEQGAIDEPTQDKRRRLYSKSETSGGSLDDPLGDAEDPLLRHETLPSPEPTPEDQALLSEQRELDEQVKQFMRKELGEEFYRLRFGEQKSWEQVAKACRLPSPEAAQLKLARASRKARERFTPPDS